MRGADQYRNVGFAEGAGVNWLTAPTKRSALLTPYIRNKWLVHVAHPQRSQFPFPPATSLRSYNPSGNIPA